MRIVMTKAQALDIQARQIKFYSETQGISNLGERVAAVTYADRLEDGIEYSVGEINKYIPRGASIEYIIAQMREDGAIIARATRDAEDAAMEYYANDL